MKLYSLVSLPFLFLCFSNDKEPKEIIRDAIKAQGGQEALRKSLIFVMKTKGFVYHDGEKHRFEGEVSGKLPSCVRLAVRVDFRGRQLVATKAFSGKDGWERKDERIRSLSPQELTEMHGRAYEGWVKSLAPLVDDSPVRLVLLEEENVLGIKAIGIRVSQKARNDVSLFFDKQKKLLVRSFTVQRTEGKKDRKFESLYLDYKKFGDLVYPSRTLLFINGTKKSEEEIVTLRFPGDLDKELFLQPKGGKEEKEDRENLLWRGNSARSQGQDTPLARPGRS